MDDKKKKNPWAQNSPGGNNEDRPSWNGPGGTPPPDLEEMLRRARAGFDRVMPGPAGGNSRAGVFFITLGILLWLASGFYTVNPGQNAVIQRFGALNRTQTDAGLGYRLPWPVESLTKVSVAEVRRMGIGFTEYAPSDVMQKQDIP